MKRISFILLLLSLVKIAFSQSDSILRLEQCKIHLPAIHKDFKKMTSVEKSFYEKQWAVLAKIFEGEKLLIQISGNEQQEFYTATIVTEMKNPKSPVIKIFYGNDAPQKSFDIYSDLLKSSVIYLADCNP